MARPLRIEIPGACYHVINRGNFRFPILREDRDKELLLRKLVHFAAVFRVRIRAYCIQPNHFHCYVRTEEANLGRFMQSFLTSFGVSYNRRHDTAGHVFQGRYKAFLVEDRSAYRDRVSRYIHLNPGKTSALCEVAAENRRSMVRCSPWSSYPAIVGLRPCPNWLDRMAVLEGFPGTLQEKQEAYARYVEQGLVKTPFNPHEEAAAGTIIGSARFVDHVRRSLTEVSREGNIRRETGRHRALAAWVPIETVIAAVADHYGLKQKDITRRSRRCGDARQLLLYLAATYCQGRYSLSSLAEKLGGITVSGIRVARRRVEYRLASPGGSELRAANDALVEQLACRPGSG